MTLCYTKIFLWHCPFVGGIHRSPVDSPHKAPEMLTKTSISTKIHLAGDWDAITPIRRHINVSTYAYRSIHQRRHSNHGRHNGYDSEETWHTCLTICQKHPARSLGYLLRIPMLKPILVNKDLQTWHLIGWQHGCQPIRSHVRKSVLTNMEFNMDFT